jgi:hypothetical protein
MIWLKQSGTLILPSPLKDTKLQPINGFSLFLVLDLDIPHRCVEALVASEIFYGERAYPLLM